MYWLVWVSSSCFVFVMLMQVELVTNISLCMTKSKTVNNMRANKLAVQKCCCLRDIWKRSYTYKNTFSELLAWVTY